MAAVLIVVISSQFPTGLNGPGAAGFGALRNNGYLGRGPDGTLESLPIFVVPSIQVSIFRMNPFM